MTLPHGPSFRLLDFAFAVDCPNPALADLLCRVYAPFRTAGAAAPAPAYVIRESPGSDGREYEGVAEFAGEPVTRASSRAGLFTMVLWDVNRRVALAAGRSRLLLHAAAAAAGDAAVLLSAPTESGKSTLVTALVESGLAYVTDEFVAVDPVSGLVTPVPKAIGLDPGSWPLFPALRPDLRPSQAPYAERQWQVLVQQWRPDQVRTEPVRPAVVVLPRYRAGEPTRLEPVSRAATVLALADQTFEWPARPLDRLTEIASLVRHADCYRLAFSRLDEAVETVRTVLHRAIGAHPAVNPAPAAVGNLVQTADVTDGDRPVSSGGNGRDCRRDTVT